MLPNSGTATKKKKKKQLTSLICGNLATILATHKAKQSTLLILEEDERYY